MNKFQAFKHFYLNPPEHDEMSILNHSSVVGWKIRHLSGLVKKTAGQTCLLLRAAIHSQRTLQTFALSFLSGWEILRNKAESLDFHSVFHSNSARLFPSLGPFGDSSAPLFPRCMCAHCKTLWAHSCTAAHSCTTAQCVMCAVQNAFKRLHCGQLLLTHSWKCSAARTCNRLRKHSTQHWWH